MDFSEYVEICNLRLNHAIEKFTPPHVWVAYSGGTDSALVLEIVRRCEINVPWGVMTIDTGLSSEGHIDRIQDDLSRCGLDVSVFYGDGLEWWVSNVHSYGYAYTRGQHAVYYRALKESAIEQSIRAVKTKYHQKVLSVTGVRRAESRERQNRDFVYANRSSRVTVNLIADLSDYDKQQFLHHAEWYRGRLTEDCMCNWHRNFNARSPMNEAMRKAVVSLDTEMGNVGMWRYGEKPSKSQVAMFSGGDSERAEMPDDSLCHNCMRQMALWRD